MSVLIKGGRIITAAQDYVGDIYIEDERIRSIGYLDGVTADQVIDASGRLVFPGGVDPHTHLDAPLKGTTTADDFRSGTIAAATGGTTSIIDFPVQQLGDDPRVSNEEWYGRADGNAVVDWGLHQIITELPDAFLPAMDDLVAKGVTSFKLFMAYPGARMVDDGTIFKAMRHASGLDALILMHCENGPAIQMLENEAIERGDVAPVFNSVTRPPASEAEATSRAVALAELANVPVYVVHLSSARALAAVAEARQRGLPMYAETCPQYLLLTKANLDEPDFGGAKYVMCPPLRTVTDQEALWAGLRSNDLQVVSTDHTPFNFAGQKEMGRDNFAKIPNGVPGIEWRTSLLYHAGVRTGRLSLNRFVELISTNPAKLFGLYPQKGEIAPGADADLVVFDPDTMRTMSASNQMTKADYNPYEGWEVRGVVDRVLLRGRLIVDNGQYVGGSGGGQFLKRGPSVAVG